MLNNKRNNELIEEAIQVVKDMATTLLRNQRF